MWWKRGGDYAAFLSTFSPEMDSPIGLPDEALAMTR
jgi:hypothetical protein